jgi:predicted transcriptional regulator
MGHVAADRDDTYSRLQQRLDRMLTEAPDAPAFRSTLRLLFSPEEAELAAAMPGLCTLGTLAARVDRDEQELGEAVTRMARRGLVFGPEDARRAVEPLGSAYLDEFLKAEEQLAQTGS